MNFVTDAVEAVGQFLADVWHAIENFFSPDPPPCAVKPCPLNADALTPEQAQQWFDHLKNDRPDIPFNYPVDCCYTRAREMAKELKGAGVPVGKAWNYAQPPTSLHVPTPNVPPNPDGSEGAVDWVYHVAPIVPVRQPDGSIQQMVIDPSMESGPVPLSKWQADQNNPNSVLTTTDSDPYYRSPDGKIAPDPGDAAAKATLQDHANAREKLWAGH